MRQLIQSAVAALAVSGATATAFGGTINSVSVTPARPTQDAVVTWDASPNYTAYGAAWTNSDSSRSDPGQSFLMPQNASVGSVAVRLTTANIGGNPLVQNANGEPVIVSLESYTDGTDFVPDSTVASYTGNLPSDFETTASNPGDWITFTFDQTTALSAGNYYGIRFQFANAGSNLHRMFLEIRGEVTPVYDGMTSMYLGAGYQNYNGNQYPLGFVVMAESGPPTWNVNSSGDWNVASNWNGGTAPNAVGAEARLLSIITSNKSIYTDTAVTLGTLRFDNANTYVIGGSGSLTLDGGAAAALVDVQAGTQKINLPLTIASDTTLNVAAGATLKISDPVVIASGKMLTPTGPGAVVYESNITLQPSSSITIASASHVAALTLQGVSNAVVAFHSGASPTLLQVDALSMDAGSKLDLKNNALLVNASPSTVRAMIKDGTIDSTSATLTQDLGYLDVGGGKTSVVYTLFGDLNLDQQVNSLDFSSMVAGYGQLSGANWWNGDVNYDDKVNTLDFNALAGNFGAPLAGAPSMGSVVPEPTCFGLSGLGSLALLRRRR